MGVEKRDLATAQSSTLRLIMPEWQGGDYDLSVSSGELYPLGARLLAFLAPESDAETIKVPVEEYRPDQGREKENGVLHQDVVIRQMKSAMAILKDKKPARVVTFGGDCLVSQAPFDYLNGRYAGEFGILWIDAHPDISTPANYDREHAMVLGNLLGGGDAVMAKWVEHPIEPGKVLLVGLDRFNSVPESEIVNALGLLAIKPADIADTSEAVIKWINDRHVEKLAIHLDLDVLDPAGFYSQLTRDPFASEKFPTVTGKLDLRLIGRLLSDVSAASDIVGLTFAEFMPWDALYLQKLMHGLPIMR